jgi:hypothetical protein
MKELEVVSNALNVLGFLCLTSDRSFVDLFWFWKKKLDVFGRKQYYVGNRGWRDTWEFKYATPVGISFLLLGNIGLLVVSIFT